MLSHTLIQFCLWNALFFATNQVQAATSYANDFVDPDFIVAGNFADTTPAAKVTIAQWARAYGAKGPWTVMNKTVSPPSGDKHDYMSWAPYSWPNCTSVGNTTELTDEEVWSTCPYYTRDGLFNPDGRLINDVGAFGDMSDAILYNAIAFAMAGESSSIYSQNATAFLKGWFLDDDTKMSPNLNYAQMARGPDGQIGQHTGVLDLKGFAKIATGILILRKANSTDWTSDLDNAMIAWCKEYITWLETTDIALEEKAATNNHGSFYYNQLAALKVIANDLDGATSVTDEFFDSIYQNQIEASGEQPLEAARTRPYHYRAYNLAAMITNARLNQYSNPSSTVWNKTTSAGATIKTALDFAMTISASDSSEDSYAAELYPAVAAVASTYGDADGKYAAYLAAGDSTYSTQAYFLWDQPLAGGSTDPVTDNGSDGTASSSAPSASGTSDSGATGVRAGGWTSVIIGAVVASKFLAGW